MQCKLGSKVSRIGALLVAATLVPMSTAIAKDQSPRAASPLVAAIDRCRQIADSSQRLACYDTAAGALVRAASSGAVAVVDQTEIRQARHSLFGFTLPKIPFFSGDSTADEAQRQLDSTITAVHQLNNGYFRIVIADNNAVWETTDSNLAVDPPRVGQKITILRGPLSSYFLRINGQLGVRGRRVS